MERAAAPFLGIDVKIDAFITDAGLVLQFQTPADLLRAPVLTHQTLDLLPSFPGNARTICFALSIDGKLVCLIWAIAFQATVATKFARDSALMKTKVGRDLESGYGLPLSGCISDIFVHGQAAYSSLCALLTWRLEKHAYAIAACSQPPISKVALQVESTICH
jgi:hypothetical protein